MRGVSLAGIRRVLCLGAHCDDIEIGCGGTVLRLAAETSDLDVRWVVFTSNAGRSKEGRAAAERFLRAVGRKRIQIHRYRDGFLPGRIDAVKEEFERLKREFAPDLVLTHHRRDAHQDHRTIAELTWNTYRDHLILEYEIPKYDGDFGSPNVLVPLDEAIAHDKVHHIMECFKSQQAKPWFSRELFVAVLRIRGMEANAPSGYAEGFYSTKLVVEVAS